MTYAYIVSRRNTDPFTPDKVADALAQSLGEADELDYCVAYSGGLDSTVLLYAMKTLAEAGRARSVRAAHVDHGLHELSGQWAAHCRRQADEWDIPLIVRSADIHPVAGESIEALAREARYRLLAQALNADEVLLTAHQQDDQMETMLLQLLRGSGVRGLSGIVRRARFGPGWHVRPMLDFPRAALSAYASGAGLSALTDLSNQDHRFDRNFLRHRVLPVLTSRWPGAGASLSRSAHHCAEAAALLDDLAELDAGGLAQDRPLPLQALEKLSPVRQKNLLRFWIRRLGLPLPSTRKLTSLREQLTCASPDAMPSVSWPGAQVRRYRNGIYFFRPLPPDSRRPRGVWDLSAGFQLGAGWGSLRVEDAPGEGMSPQKVGRRLDVRFRTGGERLLLPGRRERKQLKKLFQEAGIVPWMRSRVPLLYKGDQLVAVGDRWICADFVAVPGEKGLRIVWDDHPPLQ